MFALSEISSRLDPDAIYYYSYYYLALSYIVFLNLTFLGYRTASNEVS